MEALLMRIGVGDMLYYTYMETTRGYTVLYLIVPTATELNMSQTVRVLQALIR